VYYVMLSVSLMHMVQFGTLDAICHLRNQFSSVYQFLKQLQQNINYTAIKSFQPYDEIDFHYHVI
jgi:hypothetical protein